MNADERTVLSKSTSMTISLAIIIVGAAVSAAWWFGNWTGADEAWKNDAGRQLEQIDYRLKAIEDGQLRDRWTGTDMHRWAERLQEDNTDLDVPEPVRH